jgi:hypothetical protein
MTTYYVSANAGSNSNSGTSVSSALQTLQAAANLTRPGDTVIVESGTYTAASGGAVLSITTSGTAAAPITYEAAPGGTAIISVPSSVSAGINVDASYIAVTGFQVQGDAQTLTLAQAQSQGADNATTANGINIGYDGDPTIVSHVQVDDNTVSYMPGGGIQACYADYVTVQGNTIYGNANYSPYGESGISIYASQNSDTSTAIKNLILDNTVYDNKELVIETATGNIADGEGIIIDDNSNSQTNGVQYTGGTLVENNVSYGNGSEGIQVGNSSNVDVLYNTTYQNGQSGVNQYEIAALFAPNAVIENNIMYARTGGQTENVYDSTGAVWNYNVLYNGSTSVANGANTITANPLFVNAAAGNFETTAGSPAIGAANSAYPDATDIDGVARPATGAEIGAYQYVAPASSSPPASPSPNDTVVVAGSTQVITDASGNTWGITSGGQVSVNGAADPITANVIKLAYVNGEIWQENASDLWWGKTTPGASWAPTGGTATSPLPSVSPNDTILAAGSTSVITDASGNTWGITSGGQIAVNGVVDSITANVIRLAYVNGEIWQENASDLWWGKTTPGASWAPTGGTATSPLPPASANGTIITSATATPIIDSAGNAWSLVPSASEGLQIAVNGILDPITANVVLLETLGGKIEQENASGNWYAEPGAGGSWTQISPPAIDVTNTATHAETTVSGATVGTTTADGATFVLTAPGVATVTLGSTADTLSFAGLSSVTLTGGKAAATITADGGVNRFTGGAAALTITGGTGADSYVYHAGDALMTLKDFSFSKGDSLTVDKGLQALMTEKSDGHGGLLVGFGTSSPGLDLTTVTSLSASQIHFV